MRRYTYKPRSLRKQEKKTTIRLVTNLAIAVVFVFIMINWGLPFLIGSLSFFNKYRASEQKKSAPIEEDSAIPPPVLNIPFEATNTATIKINGYSSADSKVELYVDEELKATVETGSDGSFTADNIALSLGTNNIYGQTINEKDKKSLSSKNIKVYYSNEKPKLEVSEPQDGQEIKGGDKKVRVSGTANPENSVAVNGSTVILGKDGKFTTEISINEGDNDITVTATDQFGNSNQLSKKVKYTP